MDHGSLFILLLCMHIADLSGLLPVNNDVLAENHVHAKMIWQWVRKVWNIFPKTEKTETNDFVELIATFFALKGATSEFVPRKSIKGLNEQVGMQIFYHHGLSFNALTVSEFFKIISKKFRSIIMNDFSGLMVLMEQVLRLFAAASKMSWKRGPNLMQLVAASTTLRSKICCLKISLVMLFHDEPSMGCNNQHTWTQKDYYCIMREWAGACNIFSFRWFWKFVIWSKFTKKLNHD